MKILTLVSDQQWASISTIQGANWERIHHIHEWKNHGDANGIFAFLSVSMDDLPADIPVCLDAMKIHPTNPDNVCYMLPWPGLMERLKWEIGGKKSNQLNEVLKAIGKEAVWVQPTIGLVSARVISMIVNEAYFALEDDISTKDAIDTAMKLGTGYPYGPFEWSKMIGLSNIANLLQQLSQTDTRYQPSTLLLNEATS